MKRLLSILLVFMGCKKSSDKPPAATLSVLTTVAINSVAQTWSSPNIGATNTSGFIGLPGGYRTNTGQYDYIGNFGYWWKTTLDGLSAGSVMICGLYYNFSDAGQGSGEKPFGLSIRCMKD